MKFYQAGWHMRPKAAGRFPLIGHCLMPALCYDLKC
jgi:hypothetical protein